MRPCGSSVTRGPNSRNKGSPTHISCRRDSAIGFWIYESRLEVYFLVVGGRELSHAPRFSVMLGSGRDGLGKSFGLATGVGGWLSCFGGPAFLLFKE